MKKVLQIWLIPCEHEVDCATNCAFNSQLWVVYTVDVPFTCADRKSFELRISNVIDGCYEEEVSFGAGPLPISNLPRYELDETLEFRFRAAQVVAKLDGVHLQITSGLRT